jgi:hypothetical protein
MVSIHQCITSAVFTICLSECRINVEEIFTGLLGSSKGCHKVKIDDLEALDEKDFEVLIATMRSIHEIKSKNRMS